MDEHSFRRLAPDAVAGRLDPQTYAAWRDFARDNSERESFIAGVAAAEARISERAGPVREAAVVDRTDRRRGRMFWALAPLFAIFGALGGSLGMYSWLETRESAKESRVDVPLAVLSDNEGDSTDGDGAAEGDIEEEAMRSDAAPEDTEPDLPAQVDPEDTEPEPPVEVPADDPTAQADPVETARPTDAGALQLASTIGDIRIRGRDDTGWIALAPGRALVEGDRVAIMDGAAEFKSEGLRLRGKGRAEFELMAGGILLVQGRLAVRVSEPHDFKSHNTSWSMEGGAFVATPGRFDGDLFIAEGAATVSYHEATVEAEAPRHVRLDANLATRPLDADEIRSLERELMGRHRVLLNWDCDSGETTPGLGEPFTPGALGDGGAVRRAIGQFVIGAPPGEELFTAVEDARLRMRVKADAPRLRVEMRVRLEDGYRAVDAHIEVPKLGEWTVIDVPLSTLKAGRARNEPGWLPGRVYSAFTIAPEVDPDRPLLRRELAVDDVLVYVLGDG